MSNKQKFQALIAMVAAISITFIISGLMVDSIVFAFKVGLSYGNILTKIGVMSIMAVISIGIGYITLKTAYRFIAWICDFNTLQFEELGEFAVRENVRRSRRQRMGERGFDLTQARRRRSSKKELTFEEEEAEQARFEA